jgi:hypothetical protein
MNIPESASPETIESYVSPTEAWHQGLEFDEPSQAKIIIEHLGGDPIYGFYVNEQDFSILENGDITDDISEHILSQKLFGDGDNEIGHTEHNVLFPAGLFYVCIELDCQAFPSAKRAEFRLTFQELEGSCASQETRA